MFERDIFEEDSEDAIENGERIEKYPDDKPYPSFLALKFFQKPLHVVFAKNANASDNGSKMLFTSIDRVAILTQINYTRL